jgi:sugar phosphate isomerase/epimerase
MYKVGVNLWTVYGWSPPETVTPEMLRAIAALGGQAVELVVDEAHNSEEALLARRDALRAVLDESGLDAQSIASALFWRYNLASQDESLRARGLALVERECRVAQAFGAGAILIVAGIQEPRTDYNRSYETAVATVRRAGVQAEKYGVAVGVEHVPANFLTTPREYAGFLADVGHPLVQAYVDVGNAWGTYGGYPENWVNAVRGRIAMAHVKDYSQKGGFDVCGRGDLDWRAALGALREAGYDGALMVETPPGYGHGKPDIAAGIEAARASVGWLREFVKGEFGAST